MFYRRISQGKTPLVMLCEAQLMGDSPNQEVTRGGHQLHSGLIPFAGCPVHTSFMDSLQSLLQPQSSCGLAMETYGTT